MSACEILLVGFAYPIEPPVGIIQGTPPPPPVLYPDQPPGVIMRSTDGGESAKVTTTITNDAFLDAIEFSDPATAWLTGSVLYKSFDSGASWASWPHAPDGTGPGEIAFSNGRIFMAGGVNCEARLYASFFEPPEWELMSGLRAGGACAELRSIAAKEDTIVATGNDGEGGVIIVSQDGGASFNPISFPNEELTIGDHVAIADSNRAFVSGVAHIGPESSRTQELRLLATSDGGTTWEPVSIPNMAGIVDIVFTSADRGYISGAVNDANTGEFFSGIFLTNDGGQNWEFHPFPDGNTGGQKLFAAADGTLYAVGDGGLYRGWFEPTSR